jgi:hypothetical protein
MTPKEKAEELFDKFYLVKDERGLYRLNEFIAKQCALIAVDEIIQQWEVIDTYIADFGGKLNQSLKYWQEVKQEIQAL